MTHRSLSYSGLDEIDTGLQRPRSTPIQFQNGLTERQGKPRTQISPPNHSIPENRTPSATRTFHQAGFDNSTELAQRHDLRSPVNIDPQREDLGIPSETGTFQNYIERNDAELKRIHAIDTGLWIPTRRNPGSSLWSFPGPVPGSPPSSGKWKTSDKENLPYFRIWKSLTYSTRLRPALGRLYKGNLNPKAEDGHFET
ncbi:hypothetical protein F2Q68_00005032 [Brassica cretica]|uniref:Uncharacterized protein n=1 Tax=Brassica cretica TaxID=69181 RepID=A0A8S9JC78_BRACR|nr:hypothetical protein F2Q68_00005032 [Brassica cretica]